MGIRNKCFPIILSFALCISLFLAACDGSTTETSSKKTIQSVDTIVATVEDTTKLDSAVATEPDTSTTSNENKIELEKLVELSNLSSYRITMTVRQLSEGDPDTYQIFDEYYITNPPAKHIIQKISQNKKDPVIAKESIVIGEKEWVKSSGGEWKEGGGIDFAENEMSGIYEVMKGNVVEVGSETINDINCIHYTYEYKDQMLMKGDIWIASQPDLPKVPIKGIIEQGLYDEDGKIGGSTHLGCEFVVTDINSSLSITPPIE
jgi:hypothetical protein